LAGCFSRPEPLPLPALPNSPASPGAPPDAVGAPESPTIDALKLEKAKADAAAKEWAARASSLDVRIKDERKAAEEALRAHQRAYLGYLAMWATGVCALLFGASLFLLIWLGAAMRSMAVAGMVTFGTLGVLAAAYLLLQSIIATLATTLLWVIFAVVSLGVVAAVGYGVASLVKWKRATVAAAGLASRVMDAPQEALASIDSFQEFIGRMKEAAAKEQDGQGVRALIRAVRPRKKAA
jgi:hypothetical protein